MPAFTHGKVAQFYIADSGGTEREITNASNSASISRDVDAAEATTFGDDDKVYVTGLRDATISVEGRFDVTVDGYFNGLLGGTARPFAYCPQGSASTFPKYSGSAILTSYEFSSDLGDTVMFSAEFQVSGAVTRAVI